MEKEEFVLPPKIDFEKLFKFEQDLMQESLSIRGIKANDTKDIFQKLHTINKKKNICISNRPPLPCDYVDVSSNKKWIGHGFFYKSCNGKTSMNKDNAYEDFDSFDNFYQLNHCKVLLCDYQMLRKDFSLPHDISNENIDKWLINQTCYVSTGQVKRMQKGGNLHDLIDSSWSKYVNEKKMKMAMRQRGGGRASTFFIDDKYWWNKRGRMEAKMLDCKGIGTTEMQNFTEKKASGFLSYADALKGFLYERALRIALLKNSKKWKTVKNYAIIDIGIRWKSYNPATGIKGDVRNVILVRQAHSRYLGSWDDPVYYSVVRMNTLKESDNGKDLIKSMRKSGISSEQTPFNDDPSEGNWNVQCTASFDTLVDFSHWYFIPTIEPPLLNDFRMTPETFKTALQLQGKLIFQNKKALEYAYGTIDEEKAKKKFKKIHENLKKKYEEIGVCGNRKPKFSWSWHCEMDDSNAMKKLLEISCDNEGKKIMMKDILKLMK